MRLLGKWELPSLRGLAARHGPSLPDLSHRCPTWAVCVPPGVVACVPQACGGRPGWPRSVLFLHGAGLGGPSGLPGRHTIRQDGSCRGQRVRPWFLEMGLKTECSGAATLRVHCPMGKDRDGNSLLPCRDQHLPFSPGTSQLLSPSGGQTVANCV